MPQLNLAAEEHFAVLIVTLNFAIHVDLGKMYENSYNSLIYRSDVASVMVENFNVSAVN